ncbi:BMP family ABC transporter substrate-binding protein [Modestobacter excelsi]|uniref:BMP family ABC transporter substrate-binding protein n=1 Tax=Modestobacter excelsi TaxID=2213161 RepID=UPI001C20CFC8|nr:BMP family ABC transporter substrate-binding protein [Modestobacter excelsi]
MATIPMRSAPTSPTRAATAIAAAMLLALTACGGGDSSSSGDGGGGGGGGDKSFIYVTNDPIGTNEFLQLGKKGIEDAAKTYGGEAQVFESTDEQSQRSNIEAAIAEAPDAIVLITFDFTDLSKEYAEQNPDQQFLLIDACPEAPPANLHCAVFREQEASYLVGIEAGMLSTTKKVGSVGAVDIPFLHRYSDSFAAGAQSVDPAITDSQLWIGGSNPFADPAKGKEQALAMAATGADHVFAVGAGSNGGIFEAATEQDFFSYGVDINQCPMAPGHIVDNTMKAVDVLVVDQIGAILDGNAEPLTSYGLKEKGMDLTSLLPGAEQSQCVVMDHPDVIEAVKKAKQGIIDGTITVDDPAAG